MTKIVNSERNEALFEKTDIYRSYKKSKYLSIKHSTYFQVYEELLAKYRNKKIVFVEVGVLNGGSLFMWRHYFGPKARIIGVDFNPLAKKWEKDGFEIHIGSQSDPDFWKSFFSSVGDVDIVLDDGGHTNEQQIVTTHECIAHIKDGGLMIVEDTHTSYMEGFGNPSKYSFVNYAKKIVDGINSRFPAIAAPEYLFKDQIYSVGFYESIVSFHIDRKKCFISSPTSNDGISANAEDYRDRGNSVSALKSFLNQKFSFLKNVKPLKMCVSRIFRIALSVKAKSRSAKLKKYFN